MTLEAKVKVNMCILLQCIYYAVVNAKPDNYDDGRRLTRF